MQLPPDIPASEHQVVVIDEKPVIKEKRSPLKFTVDNYGSWPENIYLRRLEPQINTDEHR